MPFSVNVLSHDLFTFYIEVGDDASFKVHGRPLYQVNLLMDCLGRTGKAAMMSFQDLQNVMSHVFNSFQMPFKKLSICVMFVYQSFVNHKVLLGVGDELPADNDSGTTWA